jgi:hypothetical protein
MILALGLATLLQVTVLAPDSSAGTFKDPTARTILDRARAARLEQDSALRSYDASSYQRVSIGFGPAVVGRDRVIFASETMGRVRWKRDRGAWLELEGGRNRGVIADMSPPIPYYPGMEALWIEGGPFKETMEQFHLVHPLALAPQSRYAYETGDSITFNLPGGRTVRIRELRVRPKEPDAGLVVGSFWFDAVTGQLVRAAYRPSIPLDLFINIREDATKKGKPPSGLSMLAMKAFLSPLQMRVSAIAVEYGLYEGRFWLPRNRVISGAIDASIMRGFARLEQRFDYDSVNGNDNLPAIAEQAETIDTDTFPARLKGIAVAGLLADSISECQHSDHYTVTRRTARTPELPVAMKVPCDLSKLASFPGLPASIFDAQDAPGDAERDRLIARALSLGAQPAFGLHAPALTYGLPLTRFNRVEGLSTGLQIDQGFGGGFDLRLLGRYGFADRTPNVEASILRGSATQTIRFGAYSHLVAANDWGNPLSLTSSLSAGLFGADDGYYYRAAGIEVAGERDALFAGGWHLQWRLFAERERGATVRVEKSLIRNNFDPNIAAAAGDFGGGALRLTRTFGLNPRRFRLFGDLRLEGATGDSSYGRLAVDLTASERFGALTLSGGTSVGTLPPQRRWFLGGSHTVRGVSPDTSQSGNAYWLLRAEFTQPTSIRLSPFFDLGWVGDRAKLREPGRPLSGVGIGISVFDGMLRLDVARGVYPNKLWRFHVYLGGRY